jgi:hypothetical protein
MYIYINLACLHAFNCEPAEFGAWQLPLSGIFPPNRTEEEGQLGHRSLQAQNKRSARLIRMTMQTVCICLLRFNHGTWQWHSYLPVPGGPASKTARPDMFPCWIILSTTPAALRAVAWPTMPCEVARGSSESSRPRPRMCEWAPMRSMRVRSFTSCILTSTVACQLKTNQFHNRHQNRSVDGMHTIQVLSDSCLLRWLSGRTSCRTAINRMRSYSL